MRVYQLTTMLVVSFHTTESLVAFSSVRCYKNEQTQTKLPSTRSRKKATNSSYRISSKEVHSGSSDRTPKNTLSQEQRRQESLDAGHNPLLSLNLNLDALARAQAPERAQELYQRISALHREGYYAVSPDIVSFNSVLKAWQTDPAKALEFWEAEAVPGRMNVRSYNTFLLALAKAGMYEQAESLLRQMQVINAAVRPDRISWNTVLLAYATGVSEQDTDAAEKADTLLREMMLGGSSSDNAKEDHDFMSLPPVVDPNYIPPMPDATSFNTVISTWASHPNPKEAAKKSEFWLREMQQMGSSVQPDVYTYTTVLKAWSRCGGSVAADRALELLREMQETKYAQPNRVTYTVVIQTLCQNQQPGKAGRILQSMMLEQPESIRPDCVAFTALMDGWAFYAKARAAVKDEVSCRKAVLEVMQLLDQMKTLSKQWPDTAPNERTYTSVLKTLAASQLFDAGILARQVLSDMWEQQKQRKATPGTIHYNAALDCCAKVPRATKAVDAASLWQEMMDVGIPCDTITYNILLNAAANSFGSSELKERSLQIGQQAFDALQADESCQPTSLTYSYYFKMLRRLVPQSSSLDRNMLVKLAFDLCCEQGCLNEILLRQVLENAETDTQLKVLLGDQFEANTKIQMSDLPPEWSRHAMRHRSPRQGLPP
jgi:pentatricopeptide repeat protein